MEMMMIIIIINLFRKNTNILKIFTPVSSLPLLWNLGTGEIKYMTALLEILLLVSKFTDNMKWKF